MSEKNIVIIGITGSIGMGKSTAAEMLRNMGVPIHDSDATVHFLLGPSGKAVAAIGQKFPETLQTNDNGESFIDRQALGKIVFADRHRKKELEDILHPLVRAESDRFVAEMKKKNHKIVALDIPLLFETNGQDRVDVTLCVSARAETQKERVLARPGMTSEMFDRIVSGQLPDAEKRQRADYVLESDKSMDDMRQDLQQILNRIRATNGLL